MSLSPTPVIAVRADADRTMGVGHVMRCLTLAKQLTSRGLHVHFLSKDLPPALHSRAEKEGITVEVIHLEETAATTVSRVAHDASLLIADGYHLVDFVADAIASETPTMVIDDNMELPTGDTDIVLNQNLHAADLPYDRQGRSRLLLGPDYALVRPDIVNLPRVKPPDPSPRVLVAIGGSDPLGLTTQIATRLASEGDCVLHIGAGAANREREQLTRLALDRPNKLAMDRGDLTEAYAVADLAIIGGGSMLWEVAHLGIPAVVLVVADNQLAASRLAEEAGIAVVHDARKGINLDELLDSFVTLLADPARRNQMSTQGKRLVDGRGAARVVDAIEAAIEWR